MMALISEEYKEFNKQLHSQEDIAYGIDGGRWAEFVIKTCKHEDINTVLDYGCGKGNLKKAIAQRTPFITVSEYDPAIEGKDQLPKPADMVFCGDVLEHIEPEYLDDVLTDISRCADKLAVLYIATSPANKTLPDGRNAHLIQENMHWWFNKVSEFMEVTNCHIFKPTRIMMFAQKLGTGLS